MTFCIVLSDRTILTKSKEITMSNMEKANLNLDNKNALVTGASKGLGEQIALGLLQRGVNVIGTSRTGPPESFQPYIEQGQASYVLGDLANEGDKVISDIYEKYQGFEIFINNAGSFRQIILRIQIRPKSVAILG